MQAHGDGHHVGRQHVEHGGFQRQHRAVRAAAHEVRQVVEVGRVEAAADGHPGQDQGHVADAAAHHALHRLQLRDVGQLEVGLDASGGQAPDVLLDPGRAGGNRHFTVGVVHGRLRQRGAATSAAHICSTTFIWLELMAIVTWSGVGCSSASMWRVSSDSHLAVGAVAFRGEADGAADLQDHVGHAGADAGQQFIELGQALGALAVEFAHVQVQHGGAGVVAVHRLLDVLFHGDGDVFAESRSAPTRGRRVRR